METYFANLDIGEIKNFYVMLDVDGTLVFDGGKEMDEAAFKKIEELKINNQICICSNNKDLERNKKIAAKIGAHCIESPRRKPSGKLLDCANNHNNMPILVIGDKFLTDGLFAKNIGAKFIKIKRIKNKKENIINKIYYFIDDALFKIFNLARLMRPVQWIKNLFIFIPVFFAREIFLREKFLYALYSFVIFCLVASSMYIINDIADKEQDKLHPKKRERPVASGAVSIVEALMIFVFLLFASAGLLYYLTPKILIPVLLYVLLNIAYSFWLKKMPIFDILSVSSFYLLRVFAGGEAASEPISSWLVLCVIFISLLIVLGKRKSEFNRASKREVLYKYNEILLSSLLNISAALTLIAYGLYSALAVSSPLAVYSIFFVLLGIFRYLFLAYTSNEETEFPEKIIFSDKIILASIVFWIIFIFYIFYL